MFLNSSIGISEGVRATLFLRDCRKRNIIHRGVWILNGMALIGLCHAFLPEKCLGAVRDWVSRGCPYFWGKKRFFP